MINGQKFFDQSVKYNLRTLDNIRKNTIIQGDDYTTGDLLDYYYFNKYYNMIAIHLSKQQALDSNPKAIQQTIFTGNLNQDEDVNSNTIMTFIIEEV